MSPPPGDRGEIVVAGGALRLTPKLRKTKGWSGPWSCLTYQADRDNVRRDAGDCHQGARTAEARRPAPSDERTCRDDQE